MPLTLIRYWVGRLQGSRKSARKGDGAANVVVQIAAAVLLLAGANAASAKPVKIVALGDSLTAGYELPADASFPSVLQERLRADGFSVEIANAGVSGDTAAGGLERLDWSVPDGTDLVILELGANDMLRGAPLAETEATLARIIERLRARRIPVALAGMRTIANWGEAYQKQFDAIYPALAERYNLPLFPFFLEGVAGVRDLTLPDGLHPSRAGVETIVGNFLPFIEPILTSRFGAARKKSGD